MPSPKKKSTEVSKIEVENVRLSQDRKDSILARFVGKKFSAIVPECADLFPKKGNGVGTQLVPIELVRKVRASLAGTK